MEFHYQTTNFNEEIVNLIRKNVPVYQPPWWYNRNIGSCVPLGFNPKLTYFRQIISEPWSKTDSTKFALDWYPGRPNDDEEDCKIVVYFCGFSLTSESKVTQQFARKMEMEGYTTVIVSSLGVDYPLKKCSVWHSFDVAKTAIVNVRKLASKGKIFLVGYSAGTNIINKLITDNTFVTKNGICAAMCLCNNGKSYLEARVDLESTFIGRIYSRLIVMVYKNIISINKENSFMKSLSEEYLKQLQKPTFLSEFDKVAYSQLYGYDSEESFATDSSTTKLEAITIPLLVMQPKDDPMLQPNSRKHIIPKVLTQNEKVIVMEPEFGNHFGFYEGGFFEMFQCKHSYFFPAKVASQFFDYVLDPSKAQNDDNFKSFDRSLSRDHTSDLRIRLISVHPIYLVFIVVVAFLVAMFFS